MILSTYLLLLILPAECDCKAEGSTSLECDDVGLCECLENITGDKCDQCEVNRFAYPDCYPCECDEDGSESQQCDELGRCVCRLNVVGDKCDSCAEGYANFPDCDQCAALYYEEKRKHGKIIIFLLTYF